MNAGIQGISGLAELINETEDGIRTIPLSTIDPDPNQPRTHFDERRLNALVDSIKAQGIIEPLIVSSHPDDPRRYLLVVGERRWRSAKLVGLTEVPVVIRELSEEQRLAVQLIENIDREALSPIEESLAVLRLISRGMKPKEIAEMVGKRPAWVSLRRKIARDHEIIKPFVDEEITKDVETLAMLVDLSKMDTAVFHTMTQQKQLSRVQVREALSNAKQATEQLEQPSVEGILSDPISDFPDVEDTSGETEPASTNGSDGLYYTKVQDSIRDLLRASIAIHAPNSNKSGKIVIQFKDRAELEDIQQRLRG